MRKAIKMLLVFVIMGLSFGLSSCKKDTIKMPKPKGKQVSYNNFELERKFDRLKFENKKDRYIEILETVSFHDEDIDDKYGRSTTYKGIKDTNSDDLWIDLEYSYYELDGKYEAKVKGYESKNYTYFDINYKNNKKFEEDYDNFELYNGKYKIKKETSSYGYQRYGLYWVLSDYYIYFNDDYDFSYFDDSYSLQLFLEINEIGYKNLKFYETNELFTIELKITLNDLKKEKDDFYDIIDDWFYLPDDIKDIKEFDAYYIFVFEKNYLIEAGYKMSYSFSVSEGEEFYKKNLKIFQLLSILIKNQKKLNIQTMKQLIIQMIL